MAAAPPSSAAELIDLVRKSGILPADRLEALPKPEDLPPEPPKAATVLFRRGFITKFQGQQLLQGRYRGFRMGPYVLRDQLGRGGMGQVYLGEHVELRRNVALKVLVPGKGDDQRLAMERFLREARAAAALDHPNIVRIFDVAREAGVPYLVMEYVEGETLQQVIDRDGALPYAAAADYVAQAAAGLQHAHEKGFVHRDIKPANLMRDQSGTVKILDMGLARSEVNENDKLTEKLDHGAIVGTADFIAPEQAVNGAVDVRADIYSLGATFFALLTGKPPFDGNTTQKLLSHQMKSAPHLSQIDASLPGALTAVVAKMLAKKPEHRYQTPAELIAALTPWLGNSPRVLAGLSRTSLAQGAALQAALGGNSGRVSRGRLGVGVVDPGSEVDPSRADQPTDAIAGADTIREPVDLPDEEARPRRRKLGLIAATAAGVFVLAGVIGWAASGGSKAKDAGNHAAATDAPPAEPPAVAEPPASGVLFRFDAAAVPQFRVRLRGGTVVEGKKGSFPRGVVTYALRDDTVADFFLTPLEGKPALGVLFVSGSNGAEVAFELEKDAAAGGVGLKLTPGSQYKVRVEYRTDVGGQLGLGVHSYQFKPAMPYKIQPPGGGKWQTVEAVFTRGPDPLRCVVENRGRGEGNPLFLRSVEISPVSAAAAASGRDGGSSGPPTSLPTPAPTSPPGTRPSQPSPPARPAASAERVLYNLDLAGQKAFNIRSGLTVGANNQKTAKLLAKTGPGEPPAGWVGRCWNADSQMEFFADAAAGGPALGIRNVAGPSSAMLFMPKFDAPTGVVRLKFEYQATTRDKGFNLRFKPSDNRGAWDVAKPQPTGDAWRTEELVADLKGATGGFFEFHNNDASASAALRIRSVTVTEAPAGTPPTNPTAGGAAAPPAEVGKDGAVVYKLELAAVPAFRVTKENHRRTAGDAEQLPPGVHCYLWKPEATGEFRCEAVDGGPALGVTNFTDKMSGQFAFELEKEMGVALRPGKTYRVRVGYATRNDAAGSVTVQTPEYTVVGSAALPNTGGQWRTASATFTRAADVPLRLTFDNNTFGEGNLLLLRSVEIVEVEK